jgi:hypothetical protein
LKPYDINRIIVGVSTEQCPQKQVREVQEAGNPS